MTEEYLQHHGILGMHWGIRRFQNPDGSLTSAGKQRYKINVYERVDGYKKTRLTPDEKLKQDSEKWKQQTKDAAKKDLKNLAKSALGIYKDGDGNPFVSEKRREDRRRQQEEQAKVQEQERLKKQEKETKKLEKESYEEAERKAAERQKKKQNAVDEDDKWTQDDLDKYFGPGYFDTPLDKIFKKKK